MAKEYVPPANYDDLDGNVKQFTYVDHDVKTKISNYTGNEDTAKLVKEFRQKMIKEVLAMPAVSVADSWDIYQDLIIRGKSGIKWNKEAVTELLMTTDHVSFLPTHVWKKTVKESHWFDEMDHEAILRGDWKKLM